MADSNNTPGLPGGSNFPKLPGGSGGGGKNPLEKKELDILDPEATPQEKGKKGLGDIAKGVKKSVDKVKKLINFLKSIPPQVLLVIAIVVLIIFVVVGVIGFILFIPGLAINALKQFAQGAIDTVQSWFTTDADAYINEEDIIDLANYLEELEYDLIGYGFIIPNPGFSNDLGILTHGELVEQGYIYFEKRGDDENARYYSQSSEEDPEGTLSAYVGYYYNSLGIMIDNSTGAMVDTDSYTDQYGIERSTEETSSNGAGKIVGFGNDFLSGVAGWTVDTNLLRTYLLSDYRIYAIRNNDQGLLANIFKAIKQTFGGYDSAWSKGLIKFYYSENGLATQEWSSSLGHWIVYGDDIKISRTSTGAKMSVKNGHFNNPTIFTIDGWSDRYGMSLEFLLSLHIATMQPDLVYAMLQSFDTEVQVYLDDSGEATVDAAYVDMMDETKSVSNEEDRIMIDDVEQTLSQGGFEVAAWAVNDMAATEWVNGLAITKKNAQYLLRYLPLESPPNCTGEAQGQIIELATDDTVFGWRWASTNSLNSYNLTEDIEENRPQVYDIFDDYEEYYYYDSDGNHYIMSVDNCDASLGNDDEAYLDDDYSYFEDSGNVDLSDYGYVEDEALISEPQTKEIETSKTISSYGGGGMTTTTTTYYKTKEVVINRTYTSEVDGEEVEYEWITIKYLIYCTGTNINGYESEYDEPSWVDTIIFEFIIRDKTNEELVDAGLLTYDEESGEYIPVDPNTTRCSDEEEKEKCCTNCKKYVRDVVQALGVVSDQDYRSYTPYIARVLGSWFRDTYFIIPENADTAIQDYTNEADRSSAELEIINNSYGENATFVEVDEEYLADTEEYWTAYVMKEDESGNPTEEYQLFYLYPNGITSDYKMEDFLADPYTALEDYQTGYASRYGITSGMTYSSKEEAEEAGHAFVKKAQTATLEDLSNASLENVLWSAYEFNSDGAGTGWIRIEYEDDNDQVNDVYDTVGEEYTNEEGGFYYNITSTNEVTQVEDAQRSQTNPTVKWLFKYRQYYTYDGSEETAMRIAKDKEAVLTWVENYLKNTQNLSATSVARTLGNFGRSALRQTYSNTTITFDWSDISEQWLDWQLDMYYSGIVEDDAADDYVLDDLAFIATLDENGDTISITQTSDTSAELEENQELRIGDPRNPDLISTTNITKTSLEAFTILENTKTLAAEYAYRDFKELIVELDYFDKEELSDAIEEIFTWVLPDLSPMGWPVRPWDKQDEEYGALIESSATYDYLEEINYEPPDDSGDGEEGSEEETEEPEETDETDESVDITKIQFVGDSWINGLGSQGVAESTYFYGVDGKSASSSEMSIDNITVASDASAIVLYLGVNDTSSADSMNSLIDSLISRYSVPVYVIKVNHVGSGYSQNSLNADTMNSNIDSYNSSVQSHCSSTEGAYFIDTSSGLQDENGYLSSELTSDNLHLNSQEAYQTWYNNIINGINGASGSGSNVVSFEGYEGGEYVSSPVTGKIIEYGTHKRTNVYTGEVEEVGYVVIEAMDSAYFTEENVATNSGDTDGIENQEASEGLNLFYEEYEETCAGFVITIDGFKVDLNTTDDEGNNGSYEQNEVVALYNSEEQEKREANEQAKDDAPFFVNYGESADLGSLPEEYYCDLDNESKGYYIKEGKYLGVTYTDDESAQLTVTTEGESNDIGDGTEYTGPANYIRIMLKDKDYSIIDNVEDYFDIPDPEQGSGNGEAFTGEYSEEFLYWLFIATEGAGGGDSSLQDAVTRGYSIAGDIGDGTITAAFGVTNWCNELFWNLGYQQYVNNQRGSNIGMNVGDHIPIEVCNDVAIAELDTNVASIQNLFPGQTFTETQMAALISVCYNFGSIPDSLKSAISSGNEGTIASTWTTLGSGQWGQYPGLRTRREAEYKMWSEGKYYHCYGGGELVFTSQTPFTDFLNGNFSVCNY